MPERQHVDPLLRRYYETTYGPWVRGDYRLGQLLISSQGTGEVLWSYRRDGGGPLTYLVDDHSGWPKEIRASEVEA